MHTTSLPTQRVARHNLFEAVARAAEAWRGVAEREAQAHAGHTPLADGLHASLMAWAEAHMEAFTPDEAWELCATILPRATLERAILNRDDSTAARLYAKALPQIRLFGRKRFEPSCHVPDVLRDLSSAAILRMINDGLVLVQSLKPVEAAELYLTKGKAVAGRAWRALYPRKNPALTYWETRSLSLPHTLHPDGAEAIVDGLMNDMFDAKTQSLLAWRRQRAGDPRLLVAMILIHEMDMFGDDRPLTNWLPESWQAWGALWRYGKDDLTAHEKLQERSWTSMLIDPAWVLQLPGLPDTPEDLRTLWLATQAEMADA